MCCQPRRLLLELAARKPEAVCTQLAVVAEAVCTLTETTAQAVFMVAEKTPGCVCMLLAVQL